MVAVEELDHESEVIEPVRAGLIADAEGVQQLRPALAARDLQIVAQSGMRQPEGLPDVPWFDDARAMTAQTGVQALLVAVSPRAAFEVDALVADKPLPIWRLPPLARSFAEGAELITRVRQRRGLYRVASWWDAVAEEVRWALRCREGFKPLFSTVRVSAPGPVLQSWRSSRANGPGGVLATDAYAMLEALVAVRALPERVYGSIGSLRRRPDETPRETEDVALAILRYEGGTTAVVEATWDASPPGQSTHHHGAELSVVIEPTRVAVYGSAGELIGERPLATEVFLRQELERFTDAVRHPVAASEPDAALERHLAVLALLEAIYLSARTGQPESPAKFYEVRGWPQPR